MADSKPYRRLTRSFIGVTALSTLWEADDHLLLVRARGVVESYSRYALRDIRAIVIASSDRRLIWTWIWGGLAAIFLLWTGIGLASGGRPIAAGIFLALMLLFGAINFARGPSCTVYLNTRLGYAKLPVWRVPAAHRLIARVQPSIQAARNRAPAALAESTARHARRALAKAHAAIRSPA